MQGNYILNYQQFGNLYVKNNSEKLIYFPVWCK
jgi:hypothetical protein